MGPTSIKQKTTNPRRFYNELASDYDAMTGFELRFPQERPFFRMLVERYQLKTAFDAGCGTGFHSLLLAQLGVQVTASDISEQMLIRTRRNAKAYHVRVKTINAAFPEIKKEVRSKFDSVFCLGNTAAHLLTEKELYNSFKSFYHVLNPGGFVFIQIVNYERILMRHERVQSIQETNGKMFVRFYDYDRQFICFNILTIDPCKEGIVHALHSVKLRPWKASDIVRALNDTGFTEVKVYGSIAMDKYDGKTSKDAVILAGKTG